MSSASVLPQYCHTATADTGGAPIPALPDTTPKRCGRKPRHGLTPGSKLPKGCGYVARDTNRLRRELEAAVVAAGRELTIIDSAHIATAIRWERHGLLAARWLANEFDKLTPMERLAFSREVAQASANRDKSLAALRLERAAENIFDALYASPLPITRDVATTSASEATAASDASNAAVGVQD